MNDDFELYKGKSFKDLLKDIVTNTNDRKFQINILIEDIRKVIKNVNDIPVVAPTIAAFLDTSVKNEEHLIKLAAIIQRIMAAKNEASNEMGLSDSEVESLKKELDKVQFDLNKPIETP